MTDGEFQSPVRGLKTVSNVRTLCVRYRDLKYPESFIFPAKRLENAVDPPNVLRPQDLVSANYAPRFGFGQRQDRAQLDVGGHRMLNHHHRRGQGAAIPPPMNFANNMRMSAQNERYHGGRNQHQEFNQGGQGRHGQQNYYQERNQGGHHQRGGYNQGYGYQNHRGGSQHHGYDRGNNRGHGFQNHGHGRGFQNRGQQHNPRGGGGGYYTSNYRRN